MLLYVLESKGSSPGRQGFFLIVNALGEMEGSIGGGIMEHKMVELAKDTLRQHTSPAPLRRQIHDPSIEKDKSGMICSGEQTIFLYPLKKTEQPQVEKLIHSLEDRRTGSLILKPGSFRFEDERAALHYSFQKKADEDWEYVERTGYKNQLFIIGGGHCSLALSKLMSDMDFYIRVYEERQELKTVVENNFAHEKQQVADYSSLKELVPSGEENYVVIMTFGYRTDDIVLRALKEKKYRYLGVMGSRKKMETLVDNYRKEGFDPEFIHSIHSPVGIQIKSQTPEEIAVSIAAEIIREKNK
jgi:xanthine dehydrogenase accessory factor